MNPLISIKIPTYNCAIYLKETLSSILNQKYIDLDLLDIEVVDDFSTMDNPESVVKELGNDKIKFFRQKTNVGAIANFNTCIQRAKCEWVHILHGDDIINNDFYFKYLACINKNSSVSFIASRVNFIDVNSNVIWEQSSFTLPVDKPFRTDLLINGNVFATPSVMVKKSAYEELGFFKPFLNHTADWEMWSRIVFSKDAILINEILCSWRDFQDSDTKKVRKNGNEIKDHATAIVEISTYYKIPKISYKIPIDIGIRNCYYFIQHRDFKSFFNNYNELVKLTTVLKTISLTSNFISYFFKSSIKRYLSL